MRLVLNLPLPAYQGEQAPGRRPLGAQAGDPIDHFYSFRSSFLEEDVTSQRKHLRQPRPIAGAHQGRTRRKITLLDAPMAEGNGLRGLLPIAEGRQRKDQRDIGSQLRLVLFDEHNIIAALPHNRLRDVALGQERIHRDNAPFQDQLLSESLNRRALIRFVVHGVLGQCHAYLVRQRR
jgi:hypothetical protein